MLVVHIEICFVWFLWTIFYIWAKKGFGGLERNPLRMPYYHIASIFVNNSVYVSDIIYLFIYACTLWCIIKKHLLNPVRTKLKLQATSSIFQLRSTCASHWHGKRFDQELSHFVIPYYFSYQSFNDVKSFHALGKNGNKVRKKQNTRVTDFYTKKFTHFPCLCEFLDKNYVFIAKFIKFNSFCWEN